MILTRDAREISYPSWSSLTHYLQKSRILDDFPYSTDRKSHTSIFVYSYVITSKPFMFKSMSNDITTSYVLWYVFFFNFSSDKSRLYKSVIPNHTYSVVYWRWLLSFILALFVGETVALCWESLTYFFRRCNFLHRYFDD